VDAARGLVGARLVREDGAGRRIGRIVEVEAYGGPEDRASHARFGHGSRAATMFGAAGRAYVYGVYGMHTCLNVVTGPPGQPSAILIRAVEPLEGADAMRLARLARALATRRADQADPAGAAARLARVPDALLAVGPGNLAAAFDVAPGDDGADLLDPSGALRLEPWPDGEPSPALEATPRVGVAYAGPGWADRPWRFALARRHRPRRRR
jgi:DNA-3-methyladenine glycosylase